ncbi:hypothetical protein CTA2_10570 [Colletotrichum tanaceti]|nr:hypothetical protein CTA2_10570 [Colletotrichum tanaceti]
MGGRRRRRSQSAWRLRPVATGPPLVAVLPGRLRPPVHAREVQEQDPHQEPGADEEREDLGDVGHVIRARDVVPRDGELDGGRQGRGDSGVAQRPELLHHHDVRFPAGRERERERVSVCLPIMHADSEKRRKKKRKRNIGKKMNEQSG